MVVAVGVEALGSVAVAVVLICVARADRRAFLLPGGDGAVIMAAGAWVMFLVFYRQLDRPTGNETGVLRPAGSPAWSPVGVDWGIFVTFVSLKFAVAVMSKRPPDSSLMG